MTQQQQQQGASTCKALIPNRCATVVACTSFLQAAATQSPNADIDIDVHMGVTHFAPANTADTCLATPLQACMPTKYGVLLVAASVLYLPDFATTSCAYPAAIFADKSVVC